MAYSSANFTYLHMALHGLFEGELYLFTYGPSWPILGRTLLIYVWPFMAYSRANFTYLRMALHDLF